MPSVYASAISDAATISDAPTSSSAQLIRDKLAAARLYVCTDARRDRNDFAEFVDAAYTGGVDIIQLRDKNIEAAEELEYFAVLRDAARRHSKLFSANDRVDITSLAGAPVFHAGQGDLPVSAARQLLGDSPIIGLSTHSEQQIRDAISTEGLDYFCTGPVWATPTKPGRAAVGLDLVRYAAAQVAASSPERPWFAIGGIDRTNVGEVVDAGAHRIVVVRAVTEADDPAAAARELKNALP